MGGSRNTIILQPLSLEGQIGVNVALGISFLTLTCLPCGVAEAVGKAPTLFRVGRPKPSGRTIPVFPLNKVGGATLRRAIDAWQMAANMLKKRVVAS